MTLKDLCYRQHVQPTNGRSHAGRLRDEQGVPTTPPRPGRTCRFVSTSGVEGKAIFLRPFAMGRFIGAQVQNPVGLDGQPLKGWGSIAITDCCLDWGER